MSSSSSSVVRIAKFIFLCCLLLNWRPPVPAPDGLKLTRRVFFERFWTIFETSPRSSCSKNQKYDCVFYEENFWKFKNGAAKNLIILLSISFTNKLVPIVSVVVVLIPDSISTTDSSSRHFNCLWKLILDLKLDRQDWRHTILAVCQKRQKLSWNSGEWRCEPLIFYIISVASQANVVKMLSFHVKSTKVQSCNHFLI